MSVDSITHPQAEARQHRSQTINELAKALSAFQAEISHPKKSTANAFFKSSYADLSTIVECAAKPLAKYGLSVTQIPSIGPDGSLELITEVLHTSGQFLRSYYPVRPAKNDPQGVGSAITYARRYAYQAMLGIAPHGEDDDGNAASAVGSNGNGNGHHAPARNIATLGNMDGGVRDAVQPASAAPTYGQNPSDKQIEFLKKLAIRHRLDPIALPEITTRLSRTTRFTAKSVSLAINALKDLPVGELPSDLLDLVKEDTAHALD